MLEQGMKKINKSLILKAKKGDPQSQHELAFEYWSGENLKQDFSEAMKWWKLSASNGFGKAYFNLGSMYYNGDGVPANYKKAYYYLNLSIKKKHPYQGTSYMFLGSKFYLDGNYVKKNYKKGIKYLEIAAKKNCIRSQFLLGSYYDEGVETYNIKKNINKSFKFYKMAADNNLIPALRAVAAKYANGQGVKKNLEKAFKYFSKIETTDNDKLLEEMPLFPKDRIIIKKMIDKEKIKVSKILFKYRKNKESKHKLNRD